MKESNKIDKASTFNEFNRGNIMGFKHNIFLENAKGNDYNLDSVLKDSLQVRNLHPNLIQSLNPKIVDEINSYYHEIRQLVVFMGICH
jgi:hypothetical protein